MWQSRHLKYAVTKRISGCALFLWQWILETSQKEAGIIEINLKDFNCFVEKRRGRAYDPHTLKLAIAKLIAANVLEDFSLSAFKWFWKRVRIRSIELLVEGVKPPKRKSAKIPTPDTISDLECSNLEAVAGEANTSSSSDLNPEGEDLEARKIMLCQSIGANYTKKEARFLSTFSWEQLTAAIKCAIAYGLDKIERPCGWLRWALETNHAQVEAERAYYSSSGGNSYTASELFRMLTN